jgi:hypothetical protein
VRGIKKELPFDSDINGMVEPVTSCPGFFPVEELFPDELPDGATLLSKPLIGYELGVRHFNDEAAVSPFR